MLPYKNSLKQQMLKADDSCRTNDIFRIRVYTVATIRRSQITVESNGSLLLYFSEESCRDNITKYKSNMSSSIDPVKIRPVKPLRKGKKVDVEMSSEPQTRKRKIFSPSDDFNPYVKLTKLGPKQMSNVLAYDDDIDQDERDEAYPDVHVQVSVQGKSTSPINLPVDPASPESKSTPPGASTVETTPKAPIQIALPGKSVTLIASKTRSHYKTIDPLITETASKQAAAVLNISVKPYVPSASRQKRDFVVDVAPCPKTEDDLSTLKRGNVKRLKMLWEAKPEPSQEPESPLIKAVPCSTTVNDMEVSQSTKQLSPLPCNTSAKTTPDMHLQTSQPCKTPTDFNVNSLSTNNSRPASESDVQPSKTPVKTTGHEINKTPLPSNRPPPATESDALPSKTPVKTTEHEVNETPLSTNKPPSATESVQSCKITAKTPTDTPKSPKEVMKDYTKTVKMSRTISPISMKSPKFIKQRYQEKSPENWGKKSFRRLFPDPPTEECSSPEVLNSSLPKKKKSQKKRSLLSLNPAVYSQFFTPPVDDSPMNTPTTRQSDSLVETSIHDPEDSFFAVELSVEEPVPLPEACHDSLQGLDMDMTSDLTHHSEMEVSLMDNSTVNRAISKTIGSMLGNNSTLSLKQDVGEVTTDDSLIPSVSDGNTSTQSPKQDVGEVTTDDSLIPSVSDGNTSTQSPKQDVGKVTTDDSLIPSVSDDNKNIVDRDSVGEAAERTVQNSITSLSQPEYVDRNQDVNDRTSLCDQKPLNLSIGEISKNTEKLALDHSTVLPAFAMISQSDQYPILSPTLSVLEKLKKPDASPVNDSVPDQSVPDLFYPVSEALPPALSPYPASLEMLDIVDDQPDSMPHLTPMKLQTSASHNVTSYQDCAIDLTCYEELDKENIPASSERQESSQSSSQGVKKTNEGASTTDSILYSPSESESHPSPLYLSSSQLMWSPSLNTNTLSQPQVLRNRRSVKRPRRLIFDDQEPLQPTAKIVKSANIDSPSLLKSKDKVITARIVKETGTLYPQTTPNVSAVHSSSSTCTSTGLNLPSSCPASSRQQPITSDLQSSNLRHRRKTIVSTLPSAPLQSYSSHDSSAVTKQIITTSTFVTPLSQPQVFFGPDFKIPQHRDIEERNITATVSSALSHVSQDTRQNIISVEERSSVKYSKTRDSAVLTSSRHPTASEEVRFTPEGADRPRSRFFSSHVFGVEQTLRIRQSDMTSTPVSVHHAKSTDSNLDYYQKYRGTAVTPALAMVQQNKPVTPALAMVQQNKPVTPALAMIQQSRPVTPASTMVQQDNLVNPDSSMVQQAKPFTPVLAMVQQNNPVTPALAMVQQNKPVTPVLALIQQKKPVTSVLASWPDNRPVATVLGSKQDQRSPTSASRHVQVNRPVNTVLGSIQDQQSVSNVPVNSSHYVSGVKPNTYHTQSSSIRNTSTQASFSLFDHLSNTIRERLEHQLTERKNNLYGDVLQLDKRTDTETILNTAFIDSDSNSSESSTWETNPLTSTQQKQPDESMQLSTIDASDLQPAELTTEKLVPNDFWSQQMKPCNLPPYYYFSCLHPKIQELKPYMISGWISSNYLRTLMDKTDLLNDMFSNALDEYGEIKDWVIENCKKTTPLILARDLVFRIFTLSELEKSIIVFNSMKSLSRNKLKAIRMCVLKQNPRKLDDAFWKSKCLPYIKSSVQTLFKNRVQQVQNFWLMHNSSYV